jgi:hypothetical protein
LKSRRKILVSRSNQLSIPAVPGWRASEPGEQRVRIIFDRPTAIRRIQLHFAEAAVEPTQEFTLSWSNVNGAAKEIVRQQWNFSPTGSTREVEDYHVTLEDVSAPDWPSSRI